MPNERPRVAVVNYLNSVPLFWGLQHGPYGGLVELQFLLPSECADALRGGSVQGAILPSIEYQRIAGLKIVPGLAVASRGPVRSVLLVTRCPISEIQTLALDTSSRTSACLAQILLQRRYSVRPRVIPHAPDVREMLRECDAGVIIGDPALGRESIAAGLPGVQVYDLADEWREMTGLPFVFAIWTMKSGAEFPGLIETFQEATRYSLNHLDEIAASENKRTGLPVPLILSYLTENIDFNLDERNLEGLRLFYQLANEVGLTECNKPLEFIAQKAGKADPSLRSG
jgi:chorismate dehydratase